jgi:hypothetical protein
MSTDGTGGLHEGTYSPLGWSSLAHDSYLAIRVEWCRARARAYRWCEEVGLLGEEMRRVLAYLDWQAGWWLVQGERWDGLPPDRLEGLRAYSHRQADIRRALHGHFKHMWRYVDEYVRLGVSAIDGEEEPTVDDDDDEDAPEDPCSRLPDRPTTPN